MSLAPGAMEYKIITYLYDGYYSYDIFLDNRVFYSGFRQMHWTRRGAFKAAKRKIRQGNRLGWIGSFEHLGIKPKTHLYTWEKKV